MRSKELTRIFQQGYSNSVSQDHVLFDFLRLNNDQNKPPIQNDFQNIQKYFLDQYKNNNFQTLSNQNINIFNNSFNNNLNNEFNNFSNFLGNLSGHNSNNSNNPNFKNEFANANLNQNNTNFPSLNCPQIGNNRFLFSNNINSKNNNQFPNLNKSHFSHDYNYLNQIGNYDFNISNNNCTNIDILKNIYIEQIQLESNQRLKIAELLNLKNQKSNFLGNKDINNDSIRNQQENIFSNNYDNFFINKENIKEDKINDNKNIPHQENDLIQSQYLNIPEINSINNQEIVINSNNHFIQIGNCNENDSPNNNYFLNDKIQFEKIESLENNFSNLSNINNNSNLNFSKNPSLFNKEILIPNSHRIIADEFNFNVNQNNNVNYENLTKRKRARDNFSADLKKEEIEKSFLGNNTITNSLTNKKLQNHNNEDSNNKANNRPFIENLYNETNKNTNPDIPNNHQNQIFIINQFSKNNSNITDLEKGLIKYFFDNGAKNGSNGVYNNYNNINRDSLNNNNNYNPVSLNGQNINNNYCSENSEKILANLIQENLISMCIQKYLKNIFEKKENDFNLKNSPINSDNKNEANLLLNISEILQEKNNQYLNTALYLHYLKNGNGRETNTFSIESQISAILNKYFILNNNGNNIDVSNNNLTNIFENNFFNNNNIQKSFHAKKPIKNDLNGKYIKNSLYLKNFAS